MGIIPYGVLYLVPTLTAGLLALYSWRRGADGARLFSLMMWAVAFWSACHAISVAAPTMAGTLAWAQIQYAGIVLVGPLWLLFAQAHANQWRWAGRTTHLLLFTPAALAYMAVLSNPWHHLWWSSVQLDSSRPFVALTVRYGPLFWVHAVYSYGCILAGLALFIQTMREAQLIYRNQARLVAFGALFPIIGNLAYLMGFQTPAIDDPTPFLFGAAGLIMFYATQRFHLLDLAPIAQQAIFEGMPDGVVVLNRHGAIGALNDNAARLLAIEPKHWIGRPAQELPAQSALAAELSSLLERRPAAAVLTASYSDGAELRVVEARLRPVMDGARGRAGALLLLRDVTEHAQIEHKLDRRLADLTLLNQISHAANAAAQTDGLLDTIAGAIEQLSSWDRLIICTLQPDGTTLRITIDRLRGEAASLEATSLAPEHNALFCEMLQAGTACTLQRADPLLSDIAADFLNRYTLDTLLCVPLRRSTSLGMLLAGSAATQNITTDDLRLYETVGQLISDAIIRTRLYEAEHAASALKSAFLATVSHELRTPLTSIIGYADMLQHSIFGELPAPTSEPLGQIRHSGQWLLHMINDILDFSKMESGHVSVELYPVDIVAVIRSVTSAMQPQIHQRGLTLTLVAPVDLPLVYANNMRLEQVLTNLVDNAIKFTDAGQISIRADVHADVVRLSVQDSGIGIALEDQRQLFQPFRQLDNRLSRPHGGTGLGLAISRRLVELMEGTLNVESTLGVGSTFICELRVAPVGVLQEAAVAE